MSKRELSPGEEALAKLRVARGTLIGVRNCLADALELANRGIHTVEDCHARVTECLRAAGVPLRTRGPRGPVPTRGTRKQRAPASKAGAPRPPVKR